MRMQSLYPQLTPNTMIEPSRDLDESYVDHDGDDQVGEQIASSEPSMGLFYLLILNCGGAG